MRPALLGMLFSAVVFAQPEPSFEVASLKLATPQSTRGTSGGPGSSDPGRFSFGQATLLDLIATAYDLDSYLISSAAPLEAQRFDLLAKLPEGLTKEQFRAMMRSLLAERFHLKTHTQSKEFQAYELTVAAGGVKLKEAVTPPPPVPEGFPALPPDRTAGSISRQFFADGVLVVRATARQQTVSALLRIARQPGAPPIVDKTGLTGKYDFTLEYTSAQSGATDGAAAAQVAPELPAALRQQLGLQLVSKKIPLSVLVIDSVDKLPTEN